LKEGALREGTEAKISLSASRHGGVWNSYPAELLEFRALFCVADIFPRRAVEGCALPLPGAQIRTWAGGRCGRRRQGRPGCEGCRVAGNLPCLGNWIGQPGAFSRLFAFPKPKPHGGPIRTAARFARRSDPPKL